MSDRPLEKQPRAGEVFGGGTIVRVLSLAPAPSAPFRVTSARVEIRTARNRRRTVTYPVLWFSVPKEATR